ncbi:Eaa1 [Klebsiella pneumoniae]|nr:Eaa1 [Klebsiella pneumoniae]
MTSKFTREELLNIIDTDHVQCGEASALARMALAAMDSEPVAYTEKHEISNMHATGLYLRAWPADRARNAVEGYTIPLYRHAQPASDREQVRREHAEWSQATFGNVGPVGPLKHLSKEALEAAAEPGDLSEWADMQFLLWDAQRRAGITDEQITQAMIEKLAVNKLREWPEPKDGEPRLHIKEQPAPTFPDFDNVLESLDYEVRCNAWESEHVLKACQATYDACRAAMLQELQKSAGAEATCRSNENVQAVEVQSLTSINPAPDLVSLQKKAESTIGNYPGIPDGSEHCPCCGKKLRRTCSVESCGGKHVAHGLCQKHYDMKRWEDPEQVERFREAGRRYRGKKKSTEATPQEPKP